MISRDTRYGIERFGHPVFDSALLAAGTTELLVGTVPIDEIWELYQADIRLTAGIAVVNKRAQMFVSVLGQNCAVGRATDDPSTNIGLTPTVEAILVHEHVYPVPPRANIVVRVLNMTLNDTVRIRCYIFRHEYIRP